MDIPRFSPKDSLHDTPQGLPGKFEVRGLKFTLLTRFVVAEARNHIRPAFHSAGIDSGKDTEFVVKSHKLCTRGFDHWVSHEEPAIQYEVRKSRRILATHHWRSPSQEETSCQFLAFAAIKSLPTMNSSFSCITS